MIRDIVHDPIFLAQKSEPAERTDKQVIEDLLDTIKANAYRCVGMAANMIGVKKTVLVARIGSEFQILVNPQIVAHSRQSYEAEEGCLCHNGSKKVTRWKTITVEYRDAAFRRKKQQFRDYEAQIIQHEMDHFDGILI